MGHGGLMEESQLLRERLQAITEKHRLQENIRQKKLELDREKLNLQHLKKKSLREQWLLNGENSHNATGSPQQQRDQQQTRALQVNIHRMEMDILSLEREESILSTNESFILDRLKAVERSAKDIIKEAQDNFTLEPLQVTTVVPDCPECPSPLTGELPEPNTPEEALLAMEISVTKNLLTGQSTVLSTASVPAEDLHRHSGLKVYDDGHRSVYALRSQQGSREPSCVSELSAMEVEQLLRSASVHRQANNPYCQNPSRRQELSFQRHSDEGRGRRNQGYHHANHLLRNNIRETDSSRQGHHLEISERRLEERQIQSQLRDGYRHRNHSGTGHQHGNHSGIGHYHGNQRGRQHREFQTLQEDQPACCYTNGIIRSNSKVSGANGCPAPRSHDPGVLSPHQPQLCYTPANNIPLRDYISVDEKDLYCSTQPSNHLTTALYSNRSSTHSDRVPSPLYKDNAPFTIVNAIDTTQPITAIFMGFQTAQDDSTPHEFEGSLKAELVIIEDNEDNHHINHRKETNSHAHEQNNKGNHQDNKATNSHAHKERNCLQTGSSVNGNMRRRPGIRKIQKRNQHCCSVC